MKPGDVVITKKPKSGIPEGTRGVIGWIGESTFGPIYKFISDDSNDYQAFFTAEELEPVTEDNP
jgi:hypothetical protein